MDYFKLLDDHYQAQQTGMQLLTLFLQGKRGCGKTQLPKDYCKKHKLDLTIMNCAAIESSDMTGLPTKDNMIVKYAKPHFLNQGSGIIFFDEVNRITDTDVKSALLSLLVDREINGHKLNPSVLILTAGNCNSDEYETVELDEAFSDRLITVPFNRSHSDWIEYQRSLRKMNPLLAYFTQNTKSIEKYSLRRLERTLDFYEFSGNVEYLTHYLSSPLMVAFSEFLNNKLFTFTDLIKGKIEDMSLIDSTSQKKLIFNCIEFLEKKDEFKPQEINNIKAFFSICSAEVKQTLFNELRRMSSNDVVFFNKRKELWKKYHVFSEMEEYRDNFVDQHTKV